MVRIHLSLQKQLLIPDRLRQVPREGFSWVDRRFLRAFAPLLTCDALLLYFFLASVGDKQGLSFYGSASTSGHLHLEEQAIVLARDELIRHDLIAYVRPLTQVLSLPTPKPRAEHAQSLADIFRAMGSNGS